MLLNSLKSSRPHLFSATLFAAVSLVVGIIIMQLATYDLWWWAVLLLMASCAWSAIWLALHLRSAAMQQQSLQQQLDQTEDRVQQIDTLHSLLLHHAGQGIFGVAADGRIIFTNPAAERLMGFSQKQMIGKKMHPLIHHHHRDGRDYPEAECPLYLTLKDGISRYITDEIFWRADETIIDVNYVVAALKSHDQIVGAVVLFDDTTMVRKQQALLQQRELSLAQAQELAQMGSWRFDVQQRHLECSDECYRIFGWSPTTPIKPSRLLRAIHPEDRPRAYRRWRDLQEGGPTDIQYRIKVDDDLKWLHERSELQQADDGSRYCVGAVLDITEIKHKEAQLRRSKQRLRELVAHREQAREEERAHIAREVHDELGQQLTALRMDVTMLKLRYPEVAPEFEVHVRRMKEAIDTCIVSVRQVASSLRPAVLDMGVVASVDWLLKNFSERTGIATAFDAPADELLLDDARATAVFRVLQESLTNIARHAQATRIDVGMRCDDKVLYVNVADDGRGFDAKVVRDKRGFGLMGIRERVLVFGGQARFDTVIGQGTTVRLSIPLD